MSSSQSHDFRLLVGGFRMVDGIRKDVRGSMTSGVDPWMRWRGHLRSYPCALVDPLILTSMLPGHSFGICSVTLVNEASWDDNRIKKKSLITQDSSPETYFLLA